MLSLRHLSAKRLDQHKLNMTIFFIQSTVWTITYSLNVHTENQLTTKAPCRSSEIVTTFSFHIM